MIEGSEQKAVSSKTLGEKLLSRRVVVFICLLLTVFLPALLTGAQQPQKFFRIGLLVSATPAAFSDRVETFRRGLRELGYVEGKNIVIEYRYTEGKSGRLPALAAELVREKVEVIVTAGSNPTQAAKSASSTIPVVMTFVSDPVESGFIASLARPGGNITGLTNLAPELSGKWLELLKEMVPKASRVGVLVDPATQAQVVLLKGDGGQRKGAGCGSSTYRGPRSQRDRRRLGNLEEGSS